VARHCFELHGLYTGRIDMKKTTDLQLLVLGFLSDFNADKSSFSIKGKE
jgi:hypothetical protein